MKTTKRAAVGLGSNMGDRLAHLRAGTIGLASFGLVSGVSSVYETKAMGGPAQDDYLNAVALVDTSLGPRELMAGLMEIEDIEGRIRTQHWGPRTLDLDLLVFAGEVINLPDLVIPHPRAHLRRFVLDPLAEVWPGARLETGVAGELLKEVSDQHVVMLARHWVG